MACPRRNLHVPVSLLVRNVSRYEERLLSGYTGRLFVAITLGIASRKVGTYLLGPFLPRITSDLGISPFEAGIALSAMSVCFALLQYPSGRLSDRLSRKTVLVASVGLLLAGFALLVASPVYLAFLLAVAVVGAGDGFYSPASRALLSDTVGRNCMRIFATPGVAKFLTDFRPTV